MRHEEVNILKGEFTDSPKKQIFHMEHSKEGERGSRNRSYSNSSRIPIRNMMH